MKKSALLILFVFIIGSIHANDGTTKKESKVITPQKIEGKIIDKVTNEALAGVALQITGSDQKYYTDFDGNFSIDGIEPGIYNIDVLYLSYQGVTLEKIITNDTGVKLKVELESVAH